MTPVFLIGYMCSGKTTLGAALARALGIEFIDLDDLVESRAGIPIAQIFAQQGEAAFRQMEAQALRSVSGRSAVIACGGGTPCRPGAMELINGSGLSVYLRPSDERLAERLMLGRDKRPLIAGIADRGEMMRFARKAIAEREAYYLQAKRVFDSSRLETPEEVGATVERFIAEVLDNQ